LISGGDGIDGDKQSNPDPDAQNIHESPVMVMAQFIPHITIIHRLLVSI
jgi:hypothetical protein